MATITLNIPDAALTRVIDGYALANNYRATLDDGTPNPETKAQFCKRLLIANIKAAILRAERTSAVHTLEQQIAGDVDNINIT